MGPYNGAETGTEAGPPLDPDAEQVSSKISPLYRSIYAQVRRIPKGRVATYGQIAALAGFPRHARSVGYALAAWSDDKDRRSRSLPWQRVINAQGRVSARATPGFEGLQEEILRQEGVEVGMEGQIDLARFRWRPRSS